MSRTEIKKTIKQYIYINQVKFNYKTKDKKENQKKKYPYQIYALRI